MIRVGVVDDHPVVADGLQAALAYDDGIEVAWTAHTLEAARLALSAQAATLDVVLLDVRLPDGSGLDLLPGERAGKPAFVVLSSFDRPQYAATAFRRGAAGFLLKVAPLADIVDAVYRTAAGGLAFEARHLASVRGGLLFTPRELEVVRLVAGAFSNDEIAARLDISHKTVEAYLREIFRRHGFSTRTELALWAEREGWLDTP
jgi:DNA-binding NarL/FixJ family response regulator